MDQLSNNNKRIAKNTLFLYFRMLLIMVVTLYMSRIVLDILGAEDYGIYNVVGGVVLIFSFLNSMLTSASQRFFSYEIGRGNKVELQNIFRLNISIFLILLLAVVFVVETVGVYFINTQLTIPDERMAAAHYVFQFSILSFCATFITIPFNALIVSYERMNAFAYISILEVSLKLLLVLALKSILFDKLIAYAGLMFIVQFLIMVIYIYYCKKQFGISYRKYWNSSRAKELFSFTSWHVLGTSAMAIRSQGINILLNMFFNPTVNAARAIAYQINSAILSFSNNFFIAVKPQIYKNYANGDISSMLTLVFSSSRLSFFMLLFLGLPIFFEVNFVLSLWLKEVPEYTALFVRLVIINALLDSFNVPMTAATLATGRIKYYQIIVSFFLFLNLPISYVFLKLGCQPEITMVVSIVISFVLIFIRIFLLRRLIYFEYRNYFKEVLIPIFNTSVIAFLLPYFFKDVLLDNTDYPILMIVMVCSCSLLSIMLLGLKSDEKKGVIKLLMRKFRI